MSKIQHCGSCISIPALREEGDRGAALIGCTRHLFLSPPSARRATLSSSVSLCRASNFYPRPPRGGRPPALFAGRNKGLNFYPRPPRGGRPIAKHGSPSKGDFYPRPPRGGRLGATGAGAAVLYFYPRPPRGGRREMRGLVTFPENFYPRPPRGGRPLPPTILKRRKIISIPALREEGDRVLGLAHIQRSRFLSPPSARRATSTFRPTGEPSTFLSPPSARRATQGRPGEAAELCISIPALREEGDFRYPVLIAFTLLFLSPPSARRATGRTARGLAAVHISIPALREEGDDKHALVIKLLKIFLSPPSARRATIAAMFAPRT